MPRNINEILADVTTRFTSGKLVVPDFLFSKMDPAEQQMVVDVTTDIGTIGRGEVQYREVDADAAESYEKWLNS